MINFLKTSYKDGRRAFGLNLFNEFGPYLVFGIHSTWKFKFIKNVESLTYGIRVGKISLRFSLPMSNAEIRSRYFIRENLSKEEQERLDQQQKELRNGKIYEVKISSPVIYGVDPKLGCCWIKDEGAPFPLPNRFNPNSSEFIGEVINIEDKNETVSSS